MAAVLRSLLDSRLAQRYELRMIVTYSSPRPLSRLLTFCAALARLLVFCVGRGPRIVHIHAAARGSLYRKAVCVLVARLTRRPTLFHLHAGAGDIEAFHARLGMVRRRLLRLALRSASRLLAVSSTSAAALERCFGVSAVEVVPNPAPAVPGGGRAVDGDRPGVLYLGGFANPVKGGEPMVAALAMLAPRWPQSEFTLGGPGEAPAALTELVASQPNVRWAGWLDAEAKIAAFRGASVFVLPSLSEGLPVALLEAMSWGRAVVATRMGGVPDVVVDGKEALLVEPGEPQALAAAIGRTLGDPELRSRLGKAAQARAGTLNEDEVWGRLDVLFRELAA